MATMGLISFTEADFRKERNTLWTFSVFNQAIDLLLI